MELGRTPLPRGDLPADLVFNLLAEFVTAVEALREANAMRSFQESAAPTARAPVAGGGGPPVRLEDLSRRQRQVLAGIVRGRANKVIAWELGLSVRTVEAYRAQLFERLGARNTADAVRLALSAGFDAAGDPGGRG